MAGTCSNSASASGAGCNHRILTVNLDGETFTIHATDAELDATPYDALAKETLIRLNLRRYRAQGGSVATATNRVLVGDEATNVKNFDLLSSAATKTNISASYVNVPAGANGERVPVDFTGFVQYRILCNLNLVGAGTHNFRVVDHADNNNVLHLSADQTGAGEKEVDSGWQNLPGWATGAKWLILQAKSTTNTDDPVYRRCQLYLR